jgi:hypothetical protein
MKFLAILALTALAAMAAPAVTYSVVNDCYKETIKEVPIVLPDGEIVQGLTCIVVPRIVVDTAKADTTKK